MGFHSMFKAREQRSKQKSKDVSALNAAIDLLNVAKDTVEILPVKGVFCSVTILLALIRVSRLQPYTDLSSAPLLNDGVR